MRGVARVRVFVSNTTNLVQMAMFAAIVSLD